MAEENKQSWLTSAAPLIGGALDAVGGIFGSFFNANQAKKNRQFQERMYQRQLEDNRQNWRMANEYNLPSAQLQRIEDAGLNPLLMYEGGTSLTSSSTAQGASAPSGSSASSDMRTNFTSAATQAALIKAQIDNINADTQKKLQDTDESWTRTDWYRSTKGIQYSILKKDSDKLSFEISQIATATNALADMTWKNLEVLDAGLQYQEKYYKLSEREIENRIAFNIAQIALGNRQVDATLKQVAVNMYDAVTRRQVGLSTIAKNAAEVKKILADKELSEAEKKVKINEIIQGQMSNLLFGHYGVKDMSGATAAFLLVTSNIFPDSKDADFDEVRDMYKQYGIEF